MVNIAGVYCFYALNSLLPDLVPDSLCCCIKNAKNAVNKAKLILNLTGFYILYFAGNNTIVHIQ